VHVRFRDPALDGFRAARCRRPAGARGPLVRAATARRRAACRTEHSEAGSRRILGSGKVAAGAASALLLAAGAVGADEVLGLKGVFYRGNAAHVDPSEGRPVLTRVDPCLERTEACACKLAPASAADAAARCDQGRKWKG
jgi:hypothetical protein